MQTVREHIRAGTHPSCATREQFMIWVRTPGYMPKYFCEDCTPEYEATMKLAGRCDKYADR